MCRTLLFLSVAYVSLSIGSPPVGAECVTQVATFESRAVGRASGRLDFETGLGWCEVEGRSKTAGPTVLGVVGPESFEGTYEHPVYEPVAGVWRTLGSLAGATSLDGGATLVTVDRVRPTGRTRPVFNIEVAHSHNYFVLAHETRFLVHNGDPRSCGFAMDGDEITGWGAGYRVDGRVSEADILDALLALERQGIKPAMMQDYINVAVVQRYLDEIAKHGDVLPNALNAGNQPLRQAHGVLLNGHHRTIARQIAGVKHTFQAPIGNYAVEPEQWWGGIDWIVEPVVR